MSKGMARLILALAVAAPASVFIALAMKTWGGPEWVLVLFLTIGMSLIGLLLLMVDGFACTREAREAAAEDEVEITYAGGGAWQV